MDDGNWPRRAAGGSVVLLSLYDEENERLTAENLSLRDAQEVAEQFLEATNAQLEEARDARRRAEYESESFRNEAIAAKRQETTLEAAASTIREMRRLPSNVLEVVNVIEQAHGNKIVFTDRAKQTAKTSSLNKLSDGQAIAWECLHAAVTVLPKLALMNMCPPARFRTVFTRKLDLS
jgi:hypothetical protein